MVAVARPGTDVMQMNADVPVLYRAVEDTGSQVGLKHIHKQGKDIKSHG
jgi:hypothetical protein